jgi:hypothetical protein
MDPCSAAAVGAHDRDKPAGFMCKKGLAAMLLRTKVKKRCTCMQAGIRMHAHAGGDLERKRASTLAL